jgi:hypothetical protein
MQVIAMVSAAGVALLATAAQAQLREDEVLVVFDSRITDSLDVAAYYAGSVKVPGSPGSPAGLRRGVNVLDLATTGALVTTPGDITYANFISRLRDPIRTHLTTTGLVRQVRAIVTTKGLPHRILDTDAGNVGDNPGAFVSEITANDPTCAAVEAELALLFQDLSSGEAGAGNDSRADGLIINPYWKISRGISTFTSSAITNPKTFTATGIGPVWTLGGIGVTRLTAGDVLIVSRIDGPTVADVRAMLDRATRVYYNASTHAVVLDESDSDQVANPGANSELDNSNGAFPALRDADDYEISRDELIADTRFLAAFTRYNGLSGGTEFLGGPRIAWQPPGPIIVSGRVALIASAGANHTGRPRDLATGTLADTFYATTFNMSDGAIFNSIESYNGRDFGGLGQLAFAQQQQASTFIAAGGTFAIANVWEPLADTIPDNRYLLRNFVRGNLSWGEAALSSIPALSWMQMIVGDPLARPQRSSEDLDTNLRVDESDLYAWELAPADVNRSGTADATDRAFVIQSVRSFERAGMLSGRR